MKKIVFHLGLALFLAPISQVKGQHLLEALEFYESPKPNFILPSGVSIESGKYLIASAYDVDYLPFTKPNDIANWNSNIPADSKNEDKILDVQGKITTQAIPVYIKIRVTSVGSNPKIPAFSQTINIPAWKTQDGVSRNITLSWVEQTYNENTTTIRAFLKAEEGDLNVKKLDLNAGLGKDYQGVEVGTFTYAYSYEGDRVAGIRSFEVRALPGIPDRNINSKTTIRGIEGYNHQFLYMPVLGPDGRIWLNNNLGADYANINSQHFSPATQAGGTSNNIDNIKRDKKAFGSLFQWKRPADGHEIVKWADRESDIVFSEYNLDDTWNDRNSVPNNSIFYIGKSGPATFWRDYYYVDKLDAWKAGGANNPCPENFHVPTVEEFIALTKVDEIERRSRKLINDILRIPYPGKRYHNGGLNPRPLYYSHWDTVLWTSDIDKTKIDEYRGRDWASIDLTHAHAFRDNYRRYYPNDEPGFDVRIHISYPADGIAVRCIQD